MNRSPSETPVQPDQQAAGVDTSDGDWLHVLLQPLRPAYRQALMLAGLVNLIALGTAVYSLQVYDRVVAHGGYSSLVALTVGMLIAIAFDHLLRAGRAQLLQRVGLQIEVAIARSAFERLLALPATVLESRPPAYWQTVFRDIELVRATWSGATALLLVDLPFLVLALALLALIALPLLPVALCVIAAFVVLAWRSGRVTRDAAESEREKLVGRDAAISELAHARMLLKAIGAQQSAHARWEKNYAEWMSEAAGRSRDGDHYRDVAHGMSTLATIAITGAGALAILANLMTMGALIAANILTGRMIAPLVQLVGQWKQFGQYRAARKRLDALFATPAERATTAVALPRPQGTLILDGLSFRYPRCEHDQIQDISGQIGPHGLHAIVGANGSGKSTLLKLLRGLYRPAAGRVLLDGGDLAQFGQQDLARWIGYLPQQVQLISGSVRDNIALADPGITDEAILLAAQRACAHDFILNLPDGYATEVGEGGGRFSGGEKKRIAIAQLLLRDPPILLLDEPTADLDREAEQAFIATLRALAADHTVLVVSHSLAVLSQCNGILMLEKGRLKAAGPARQILPALGFGEPAPQTGDKHVALA
ncbi:ATP-binding cassette domain-containing protein [Pseudomonas stutzeri]|uniref:peptidase domain-containing ABC transporter n=1 Tax=Stutzerimonas stutzeri TaxID=316 RepID=UPI00190CDDF9|nr:ATP-binding cassette domain-containing protein [Stutzerimonas stutzeri]MBK3868090.1 ATP-binding cassette domain-containing protein [Stutzerimonas stutzeri]